MKILIVEDDTSSRLLLKKITERSGHETILAANGKIALELLCNFKVDAILTDWMMPEMDGLELITVIRKTIKPTPAIIMVTALSSKDAYNKAISAGADDFIAKPLDAKDVLERLENSVNRKLSDSNYSFEIDSSRIQKPNFMGVGVAASTGGPQTLLYLFSNLPATKKAAFFIVLHGPEWMLRTFPEKMSETAKMPVLLATENMKVEPGNIYLAPGNYHMIINPSTMSINLSDAPPENFVKPSADPLFRSISKLFGDKSLGVVLTGMGRDGSIGSGYIKAGGGKIIAQDPATAILPSMPASVIELKIADDMVRLEKIHEKLSEYINS